MDLNEYFKTLSDEVKRQYEAISKFKDIKIPLAQDVGTRIEGLLSVLDGRILGSGLAEFIRQREKEFSPNDWRVALDSALEMARSKFVKFDDQRTAIEMGIRVGLAYITSAIVSAPLEGFVGADLKKRRDGGSYISCSFGGPIRGAGGTAAASVIVIADALRVEFGLGVYDPSEEEISRIKVEVTDYNDFEARLQYFPSLNEIDFLMRNIPIEIDGDPTTDREVSAYKNIPRIKTNRIRGGVCLVLCEGFAQKAQKVSKTIKPFANKYRIEQDFSFIPNYLEIKEASHSSAKPEGNGLKIMPNYRYLEELAAGRPVFSYPLRSGGFRLRYGRSRTSGLAAASIHPATCVILGKFIATGSQLRVELPGKACAITTCSTIDGPIIKLKDGSVVKIKSIEQAESVWPKTAEILYLGDILFSYGDFVEQGHLLMPSPFVEEWWEKIIEKAGEKAVSFSKSLVDFKSHLDFCEKFGVPLHPKFSYFWTQISYDDLYYLVSTLYTSSKVEIQEKINGSPNKILTIKNDSRLKRILEILGVEHTLISDIIIQNADQLIAATGIESTSFDELSAIFNRDKTNLQIISEILGVKIMDTAGTFIGGRLGRPEKAKMREMETNPNVIFPVGSSGGPSRNIMVAAQKGKVEAEYGAFFCQNCKKNTIFRECETCGDKTVATNFCKICGAKTAEKIHHGRQTSSKLKLSVDIKHYLEEALKNVGIEARPQVIKGVKGVFNSTGAIEVLEKGILRSLNSLNVNKDGTIRFDAIEVPITHFKPKEIDVSIDKLREMGYEKDVYGNPLEEREQILQLKPQDIIIPTFGGPNENSAEVFIRISKFIDDLVQRYYKSEKIMNVEKKADLVGKLVVGLAPHTSSAIVGRIIGFSKTQGLFAHPFFHAAMRRNCDGDEASLMLLSDMLINFDRDLLPDSRGARYMDSPLVLSTVLDINSIDSEAYNLDISQSYPLEFYEATIKYSKPADIPIKQVKSILSKPDSTMYFTHDTIDINYGVNISAYKTLETMSEKVFAQMSLEEKLRAVDLSDIARIIIDKHFIKDIKGNLRRFGTQEFRCVKCNEKYKRIPLVGRCVRCGGNIVLTSSEGNIKKYLYLSLEIAKKFKVPQYLLDELILLKNEIDTIFGETLEKQSTLASF
ncbi:DNA polymerase II large subunit [Candidatus Parvarchaeota archaeon]|nr:DNA polymerase II large subunit [Candidatus Parvarchaeota archaeon]